MAIDFSGEIVHALGADGFHWRKGRGGSHRRYQHPAGRRVTVAYRGSNTTFVPKTLRGMIEEQAE